MTANGSELRCQLIDDGFCIVENVLDVELLNQLRAKSDELAAAQSEADAARQRSTGSMINVVADPLFADLIALPEALDIFSMMGFAETKFSSGYVISKPPRSPRLFWHYDWPGWDDPASFAPFPQQVFLMYYLVDTTRANGCLRVIPGSHIQHNPLHDQLQEAHSEALGNATNLDLPEFSDRPDEVDVQIRAGDVVMGDARLLHAAHANETNERRTVITLWYHPDLTGLAEPTQAFIAWMTDTQTRLPDSWPQDKRDLVEPLRARYDGAAQAIQWNRSRPANPPRQ